MRMFAILFLLLFSLSKLYAFINSDIVINFLKDRSLNHAYLLNCQQNKVWLVYPLNIQLSEFAIDDVYNPASKRGGTLIQSRVGNYSPSEGFQVEDVVTNKFWHRRNLGGVTFKAMVAFHEGRHIESPEEYLESNEQRDKNTYSRFHARLISFCAKHYEFDYNISVINNYGYKTINGVMDGLSGQLQKATIDFGLSALFARIDRTRAMTMGRHTWKLRSAFIFKNPKSRNSFKLFTRPVTTEVWFVLIICLFLCSIVIKLCLSMDFTIDDNSWSFSYLSVIAAVCQQGMYIDKRNKFRLESLLTIPRVTSGRISVYFTLLLTTFVYLFYSGTLVSSLLNVPLVLVKSIQDLLDLNIEIALENIGVNKEYFKFADDKASIEMYRKWIRGKESTAFIQANDGLVRARKGKLIFHVELDKAYTFLKENCDDEEVCEFKEIQLFKPINLYATYPRHSPYRDMLDVCLQRIAESGVLEKEYMFWRTKKPVCVYRRKLTQV
ncbi:uncharacterized protein LOC115877439 [Sitophilus oryzae]|uniref:Uncharacterized protein LOC115877439 n=1 Tax=Sitophilus oryzae TaxID=7048 RepID=A0A6J2XDX2_SITOR|nr:uncharacterized protein LOC115877439 [Sitophilus oryzae]